MAEDRARSAAVARYVPVIYQNAKSYLSAWPGLLSVSPLRDPGRISFRWILLLLADPVVSIGDEIKSYVANWFPQLVDASQSRRNELAFIARILLIILSWLIVFVAAAANEESISTVLGGKDGAGRAFQFNALQFLIVAIWLLWIAAQYWFWIWFFRRETDRSWKEALLFLFLIFTVCFVLIELGIVDNPTAMRSTFSEYSEAGRWVALGIFVLVILIPYCSFIFWLILRSLHLVSWAVLSFFTYLATFAMPIAHERVMKFTFEHYMEEDNPNNRWRIADIEANDLETIQSWAHNRTEATNHRLLYITIVVALVGLLTPIPSVEEWVSGMIKLVLVPVKFVTSGVFLEASLLTLLQLFRDTDVWQSIWGTFVVLVGGTLVLATIAIISANISDSRILNLITESCSLARSYQSSEPTTNENRAHHNLVRSFFSLFRRTSR